MAINEDLIRTFINMCELQEIYRASSDKDHDEYSIIIMYSLGSVEIAQNRLLKICEWLRTAERFRTQNTVLLLCADGSFECSLYGESVIGNSIMKGVFIEPGDA